MGLTPRGHSFNGYGGAELANAWEEWSGKEEEGDSSEEEDNPFSIYLSLGEVEKIWGHQYVDFGVNFKWYQKGPCPNMAPNPSQAAMVDMPLEDMLRIFLAYQNEHLPKDTLSMPSHMDQVIKMKMTSMLWQKYDMLVRQKRG